MRCNFAGTGNYRGDVTQGAELASRMGMPHEQFVGAFVADTPTKQLNTVEQTLVAQRTFSKKAFTSSTKSSGCSNAAK